MFPSCTIFGVLLFFFELSTLVAGDSAVILTITSVNVTNNPNDYFDPWLFEIIQGKKGSQFNGKIPVKKDVSETMQVEYVITMKGEDPLEYSSSFCEALSADTLVRSFSSAGIPKDTFPTECPFKAGDWGLSKWEPPLDLVPPGIPDGQFTGYMIYMEASKEPYIIIDFEGNLSHE